ncbi:pyruvate dehydrogenase E2 component (dihydrolipoamide acetyltransferase) [Poseidonocella pacifica]|uniref:Pyruvate dehydrogenase E2 component (Dihydrolipoamide acetyltransferase) n=1 Tax=Poseidonocella pacifica TaxID=871651 RepID=A0A1I0W7G7_9RHOB|nr:2-oxo acid dehydrogenase subunit E2 [Poseidonocella pacifica]SFA84632.1 pyruvate dehydrogenase E2 component (dihydrolipoamide acetyltransferase) [Poseidonocella pacifica]
MSTVDLTNEVKVVPLKGMRGMIADAMVKSLATAAQLTHHASADASALMVEKARLAEAGTKASVEDLLMLAVVRALKKHPEANGRVEGRDVKTMEKVDLSVAIALPGNLLVAPAIFGASDMDVSELRSARQDLAARAKANKLSVTEMTGGTFTVSNLGLTRVEHFTPIINAPQICILGIGRMTDRAVRGTDGGIELRPHVGLSLTFDHRALDGAPAGDLLTTICEEIEGFAP